MVGISPSFFLSWTKLVGVSTGLICCGQYLEIITWGFWLSPAVSTRDPIIKPASVSSRADNGQGLILRAMTKIPML